MKLRWKVPIVLCWTKHVPTCSKKLRNGRSGSYFEKENILFWTLCETKHCAIKDVQSRITFMCNALGKAREFGDVSKGKEESRQVEEIKMLEEMPLAYLKVV
jgi:hypothetical protein